MRRLFASGYEIRGRYCRGTVASVFVFSCKGGLENQARDVVSHYVGKTGVFPDGFTGLACIFTNDLDVYCTGNYVDPTTGQWH